MKCRLRDGVSLTSALIDDRVHDLPFVGAFVRLPLRYYNTCCL